MEKLLFLIIFTLPGFMTYILAQLLGATPSYKRKGNEMLMVSLLLWIPIVTVTLTIYQIFSSLSHWSILHPAMDLPIIKRNWLYFNEMTDLTAFSNEPTFLFYYLTMSLILSYLIARYCYKYVYKIVHNKINDIRIKNNKAIISSDSSVWDKAFTGNDIQIVRVGSTVNQEFSIGELASVSGGLENEKEILLRHVDHWTNITNSYKVRITEVYLDTKSSCKIEIFDRDQAYQAQDLYLKDLRNPE
ncbi:DUF6338 family protein [Anaerobacillus sp. 1_MG-2023]|uniref:DUF6338 family protein n=1 Tax=Anaerobacillus sp. 1_MG-2023 TaxID=3062655 RepID=UPI0026E32369|nr:DUF6338 family protein [Anaerobacillus sp. 1_MG-2023]MDO6654999.1 DUF6338 family protein [Anaerobacillus sp. 1_MG-2023]